MVETKTPVKIIYPHSVARTTALHVLLFCSLLSVAIVAVSFGLQFRQFRQDETRRSLNIAHAAETVVEGLVANQSAARIKSRLQWISKQHGVGFIGVLDQNGSLQISTDETKLGSIHDLREGSFWQWPSLITIETLEIPTEIASPNTNTQFKPQAVIVSIDLNVAYWHFTKLYGLLALGLILSSLLVSITTHLGISRQVTKRLEKLTRVIQAAEQGSFLVRAKIDGRDEVAAVGTALNRLLMHATIVQAKATQNEQEDRLYEEDISIREELVRVLEELRQTNQRLERRVKGQELLMDAANQLGGILNKDALVARLVTLVRDKLGWPDFTIFLSTTPLGGEKEPRLKLAIASGLPNVDVIRELTFRFGEGITGLVAQTGSPIVVNNLSSDKRVKVWEKIESLDRVPDFLKYGSMLSVPMLYQGRVVGVMDYFYPQLNAFDEDDVNLLSALGALVATAIVNADLYEATLELATSDSLTGVLNRRAMERLMDNEIARSQRFNTPLSILLIDVDNFKAFNDRLGHLVGDEALKAIANLLRKSVRRVDTVSRFGGEEFCVILPQTSEDAALEVAEKLVELVRRLDFKGASKQPLGHMSISVGVAVFPNDLQLTPNGQGNLLEIIRLADLALYEAKRLGRDRVVRYSETLLGQHRG